MLGRVYLSQNKFATDNRFIDKVFRIIYHGNIVDNSVTIFKNPCPHVLNKNVINVGIIKLRLKI